MKWQTVVVTAGLLAVPAVAQAQYSDCYPGPNSNEAKTMAILSVPLAFSPAAAPTLLPGLRVGIEGALVPGVDDATATPTICRPGKGPENTSFLPVFPRPRVMLPLPFGLALQASWVPPVRVSGVKANLFGFSVAKSIGTFDGPVASIRAHTTLGALRAPVTCDDEALADPQSECFEGTRSDDRFAPNIFGFDAAAGLPLAQGRVRAYAGAGFSWLRPRFQVHFINRDGQLDDSRVEVNLTRVALFGGGTWEATSRIGITGEIYAQPADAVTARLVVRTQVGP